MRIYIDLDRTLLDTDKYNKEVWRWISENYHVDAQKQLAYAPQFFTEIEDMHYYNFFTQVRQALKLDNKGLADLKDKLQAHMRENNYLLPGAAEAVKILCELGNCSVLSFGEVQCQTFKARCCPPLDNLKINVVQRPKGEFFEKLRTKEDMILIDDKPVYLELPPEVGFIHIDAKSLQPVKQKDGFLAAQTLLEAAKYLRREMKQ